MKYMFNILNKRKKQRGKIRTHEELEEIKKLYKPIDKITEEYADSIKRINQKMFNIMGAVFNEKIAPIILEYYNSINNNNNDSQFEKYRKIIESELAIISIAIDSLFEYGYLINIIEDFYEAANEAQRRILLSEAISNMDYLPPDIMSVFDDNVDDILDESESDSADHIINTIPVEYVERVNIRIIESIKKGVAISAISLMIADINDMADNKADSIAENDSSNIVSELSEQRSENIGVEYFEWRTMSDNKVRDMHAALEGMVFRWDSGADGSGVPAEMIGMYPGEDYNCRCRGLPVFG